MLMNVNDNIGTSFYNIMLNVFLVDLGGILFFISMYLDLNV